MTLVYREVLARKMTETETVTQMEWRMHEGGAYTFEQFLQYHSGDTSAAARHWDSCEVAPDLAGGIAGMSLDGEETSPAQHDPQELHLQ